MNTGTDAPPCERSWKKQKIKICFSIMKGYLIALRLYFPNNLESRSIIYYNFLVDHKIHVGNFRVSFVEQMIQC